MKLEIIDHPARRENEDGELVPLLPDNRAIKADGKCVGYCPALPGYPITLTHSMSRAEMADIKKFVEKEVCDVSFVSAPPSPEQIEALEEFIETGAEPYDDEDEDEDEDPAA